MELLLKILEQLKEEKSKRISYLTSIAQRNGLSKSETSDFVSSDEEILILERDIKTFETYLSRCLFGLDPEVAEASSFVTDKETAIRLLCMTPAAWRILDESLKHDPEVIMYYQPLGHKDVEVFDVDPDVYGVSTYRDTMALSQIGFEPVSEDTLKEAGLISSAVEYGIVLSKPKIDFPEGFDYETYFKIQSELREKTLDIHVDWRIEKILFDSATSEDLCVTDVKLIIYNRSLLSDIVAKHMAATRKQEAQPDIPSARKK